MIFKKRKGQLSLEFILLILGVTIVGIVTTVGLVEKSPIFIGNKSLEVKKETMGLFINESKFNLAVENTTILNPENNTESNNLSRETGGEYLYIKVSGNSESLLTKDLIVSGDAKDVSGDISKTINSKCVEENAIGEVYGDIYLEGSANYKLGNLLHINKFQTYLTGSGSLKVYVPYIQEFIIKDKDSGESQIGGSVSLTVGNANIDRFYVEKITGGADIEFKNFVINTFEANSGNFGGGAETVFEDGRISTMKLGDVVSGGNVKFKNTDIGNMIINNMIGSPTFELSNSKINNMKINKLISSPKISVEDSSIINSLEADQLSGSDIEVKDESIIKEIIIHGSTGNNGKIFVEDGGKVEKLFIEGSVNSRIDLKEFSGLIEVSIGNITGGGKLYVDNVIGNSILTGVVNNNNGLVIEDSHLSVVNIKGVSNSGSASIKNTQIDQLNIGSLPDWDSDITLNKVNIGKLYINEIGNGKLTIKNSNIGELHIKKISGKGKIIIRKSHVNGKYYKKIIIKKSNYKKWS